MSEKNICSICLSVSTPDNCKTFIFSSTNNIFVCDSCIRKMNKGLNQLESVNHATNECRSPKSLYDNLKKFIFGQDDPLKKISTALFNHLYRQNLNKKLEDSDKIEKSNFIITGNTGVGKTYTIKKAAQYLNIPVSISDATKLTEAGYAGDDVESIILRLIQDANYDIQRAESGIIYIDEIDKLAKRISPQNKDISGEGVQQGLLKMLEGSVIQVNESKKIMGGRTFTIDTTGILFIGGGVFNGLNKIVDSRLGVNSVGLIKDKFLKKDSSVSRFITPNDLYDFGFILEFTGRFPLVIELNDLTYENLKDIVKNSNIIKYFSILCSDKGINLKIDDSGIDTIAKKAFSMKIGARGIKLVIERVFSDIIFNIDSLVGENICLNNELVEKAFN